MIEKEITAPCGIYCAVCSRYLAYKNNLPVVKRKNNTLLGLSQKEKPMLPNQAM